MKSYFRFASLFFSVAIFRYSIAAAIDVFTPPMPCFAERCAAAPCSAARFLHAIAATLSCFDVTNTNGTMALLLIFDAELMPSYAICHCCKSIAPVTPLTLMLLKFRLR